MTFLIILMQANARNRAFFAGSVQETRISLKALLLWANWTNSLMPIDALINKWQRIALVWVSEGRRQVPRTTCSRSSTYQHMIRLITACPWSSDSWTINFDWDQSSQNESLLLAYQPECQWGTPWWTDGALFGLIFLPVTISCMMGRSTFNFLNMKKRRFWGLISEGKIFCNEILVVRVYNRPLWEEASLCH